MGSQAARRRTRTALLALCAVLAVGLGVAALLMLRGGGESQQPPAAVEPTPAPSTPAPEPEPVYAPLTGVPVEPGTALDHPAVAIKVSDVRSAHPQVGVDRADIVFVERLGVSYTRLAAVFHSDVPESVGPVRSVRPMDAPLLGPMAPVFGNTMGAAWVMEYVDRVGDLDDLGSLRVKRSTGAYVTVRGRPAPDHVMAQPPVLLGLSQRTAAPEPYFAHAADAASSSAVRAGGPAASGLVNYGPALKVTWTYDAGSGRYLRALPWGAHTMADGTQVSAVNVVALEAPAVMQKIGTGDGAPVPVLQLVDTSGRFTAMAAGKSVTGTWTKAGVNDPFELRTDAGDELRLAPGNTWVELPAPTSPMTTR
jgi:hypothetical protein